MLPIDLSARGACSPCQAADRRLLGLFSPVQRALGRSSLPAFSTFEDVLQRSRRSGPEFFFMKRPRGAGGRRPSGGVGPPMLAGLFPEPVCFFFFFSRGLLGGLGLPCCFGLGMVASCNACLAATSFRQYSFGRMMILAEKIRVGSISKTPQTM